MVVARENKEIQGTYAAHRQAKHKAGWPNLLQQLQRRGLTACKEMRRRRYKTLSHLGVAVVAKSQSVPQVRAVFAACVGCLTTINVSAISSLCLLIVAFVDQLGLRRQDPIFLRGNEHEGVK